jgi:hypothetical protein
MKRPTTTPATIADRYAAEGWTETAQEIRDTIATGGRVLVYWSLRPRGFQADAATIPADMTPAEVWNDVQRANPDAYDRPAVYVGTLGPCSIHSPAFQPANH